MSFGSPFFEGTEKKVELVIAPSLPSLRELGKERWVAVARRGGAEILSRISSKSCDAYLLSESSLFVFDHKVVMMTCGRTRLHEAVAEILESVPPDQVLMFIYERKNEVFPRSQPTSFFEDAQLLNEMLPGRAFKFGTEDEHHLYLFHLDREFAGEPTDTTLEVLMYGLAEGVRDHFELARSATTADVRAATGVHEILSGFDVDDHLFEPSGYSLNALRDDEYYTVHVTPERACSYASFETNYRLQEDPANLARKVLDVFRPRSFDLILFDRADVSSLESAGYRRRSNVAQELSCGYQVRFMSYYRPGEGAEDAVELPLERSGTKRVGA